MLLDAEYVHLDFPWHRLAFKILYSVAFCVVAVVAFDKCAFSIGKQSMFSSL